MDGERRQAILGEIDRALDALDEYSRTIDFARFTTERLAFDGVLHAMTVAGQCAIDLALMIVADRKLGAPPTDAFLALARAKVVPSELLEPLAEWASLRNVIVHLYTKLDLQKLHAAYTTKAGVLRKFRALAARALAPAPPSSAGEKRVPYRRTPAPRGRRRGVARRGNRDERSDPHRPHRPVPRLRPQRLGSHDSSPHPPSSGLRGRPRLRRRPGRRTRLVPEQPTRGYGTRRLDPAPARRRVESPGLLRARRG